MGELQGDAAVLALEQRQARRLEVDALGGDAPGQQGPQARHDGGRRGNCQRLLVGVGDAQALELELELPAFGKADGDVLDLDADAGHLLGNRALDRLHEELQRDRTLQEADVEEAEFDGEGDGDRGSDLRRQGQGAPSAAARARLRASSGYGALAGLARRPLRPLTPGPRHISPSPARRLQATKQPPVISTDH